MRVWLLVVMLGSAVFAAEDDYFRVTQEAKDVKVRDDESLQLSCTGSQRWQYCRWSFYGRSCDRTVDSTQTVCNIGDGNRVLWKGVPSIDNTCTIFVSKPGKQDSGSWACQLIKDDNQVASKAFKVTVYSKAVVSFAARPHAKMVAGAEYTVECKAQGGVPKPSLLALVGPQSQQLESTQDVSLEQLEEHSDGIVGGTVTRLFKYVPDHRGGPLQLHIKCLSLQSDSEGVSVYEPQVASSPFEVVFPPMPNETPMPTFFLDEGQTAEVTISFMANPAPKEVVWHVVRQSSNQSEQLASGSSSGRFEARDLRTSPDSPGLVTATLLVHQATFEDALNFCYMEAANALGRFEYNFALAPRPAYTEPPPPPPAEDEGSGIGVGAIVGIAVGCLLLVIAIIILVIFLVKQKRLCFADKVDSRGAAINDDGYLSAEQRDNEAQNAQLMSSSVGGGGGGGGPGGHYQSRDGGVDDEIARVRSSSSSNGASTRAQSYLMANSGSRDSSSGVH